MPLNDVLGGLLDAPPHPAPIAAVDARVRRSRRRRAGVAALAAALAVGVAGVVPYALHQSPSPQATVAEPADGPELGTIQTPEAYRLKALQAGSAVPDKLDVLARYTADGVMFMVVGHVADGGFCDMTYDDHMEIPFGGALSCGPWPRRYAPGHGEDPRTFYLARGYSSGRGVATNTVDGMAPPGTRLIVLTSGGHERRISTYDSGARWNHAVFFNAPVDGRNAAAVALDQDGNTLATAREE